jgi:glycosyltransferase involved in cell wall biosynthesis
MRATGIEENTSIVNVEFDELPGMLVQSDVLLNPRTRCAGIPQKLLNYMAAGRPIVSFAGSAKFLSDRVDALVVENGDVQSFADAMLELAQNRELARVLSNAALNLLLERYCWDSVARQTDMVYRDTLARYAEK